MSEIIVERINIRIGWGDGDRFEDVLAHHLNDLQTTRAARIISVLPVIYPNPVSIPYEFLVILRKVATE